jgi:hypothetical protein
MHTRVKGRLGAALVSCFLYACGADVSSAGSKDGGKPSAAGMNGGAEMQPTGGTSSMAAGGRGAVPSGGAPSGGTQSGGNAGAGAIDASVPSLTPEDAACRSTIPEDCMQCCDTNHPNAYMQQADATRRSICTSPGDCATPSAMSYCVSQPETATMVGCHTCAFPKLATGAECYQTGIDACGSNLACVLYVVCRANCVR